MISKVFVGQRSLAAMPFLLFISFFSRTMPAETSAFAAAFDHFSDANYYYRSSVGAPITQPFGQNGDVPVAGNNTF